MRALFCVALGSGLLACTPDVATTTGAVGGAIEKPVVNTDPRTGACTDARTDAR